MPETIWSSSNPSSPIAYRTVLDLVEQDVAKMLGPAPDARRFSFKDDDGGLFDEQNLFDFKKLAVSYATSTGGPHAPARGAKTPPFQLGTASISGGMASRHPPQTFLDKFAAVADATRDVELALTLGLLALDPLRRTSFTADARPFSVSPHGSINDNLNISRTSRHQSISEKIDNYNSQSPIQATAAMSVASDVAAPEPKPHGFWNPAAATAFQPLPFNYFLENPFPVPPNPYRPGMPPVSPPPFVMGSPAYDGMYGFMGYAPEPERDAKDDSEGKRSLPPTSGPLPGIGLMNRPMPPGAFMFHPFPYGMYPQPPPPASPPAGGEERPMPLYENGNAFEGGQPPFEPGQPGFESAQSGFDSAQPAYDAAMMPPAPPTSGRPVASKKKSRGTKGGHHIYRSPLLEEVRANTKGKEYRLRDIYGHVVEFTKDQHGSRFIQQKLPTAQDEEKEAVFNELRDTSYELMTDVFGNYVIQKFFEHGSATQKEVLLECMTGNIYDLSLQMYGCRVVQRALEALPLKGQLLVVNELRDHVLVAAKDQNGNHVIQKAIERIPFNHVRFILDSLSNHIYHLSTHPYGCRVIQRLLEYSEIADQRDIMAELNRFIFYLIQDQYGNYVIQHILERGNPEDRELVLKVALASVVNFSKHKFASNVIEKCIKYGSVDQRRRILHEVMLGNEDLEKDSVDDDLPLALMMKDQYANYVIQKLVEGFDAKSPEKRSLVVKLRQYLKQLLMKNNYGKHLASVEKMIVVAETALVDADRI